MLPQEFLNRMKDMLGTEYTEFLDSYDKGKYQALRLNTLKTDRKKFLENAPFPLTEVSWSKQGFYYEDGVFPGKHPYHEAGVYYIQEPSAMAPVAYLFGQYDGENPCSGTEDALDMGDVGAQDRMQEERILDLCAAPGGKSTQIAAVMQGRGMFVCNEIHPARAKILSENIERMGITNAMVTNETPMRLAERFAGFFTRILVDAPCSGEGMFRKNGDAAAEWSLSNVALCARRQDEILDCAAAMLAPGGRLVYATCTFAPAENEGSISRFLLRHPEFSTVRVKRFPGMEPGRNEWAESLTAASMEDTIRLWPHRLKGEGHYLAVMGKAGTQKAVGAFCAGGLEQGISKKELFVPGKGNVEFLSFAKETFCAPVSFSKLADCKYLRFGEQLYLVPKGMPAVKGLKVLRPGLHLGTVKKNRFEPSHALALSLKEQEVVHTANLSAEDERICKYLCGETFAWDGEKGWYLITVDGYSIGWGKLAGGVMKNHYPKGLRKYS